MKKTIFVSLVFIFYLSLLLPASSAQPHKIAGIWLGKLEAGGVQLRLVLKIKQNADGSLVSTLDSLDQGAADIPVDQTTFNEGELTIRIQKLGLKYSGKVNEKFNQISGTFEQGALKTGLEFKRVEKIPVVKRPQEPKPPLPYNEEEVAYKNKKCGIQLAGTLTIPRGKGPFPAVLLITGSGPQDRNETVAGHRPFLVLSDYLTRKNIAVLRVDDRGVGGSSGNIDQSTTRDFADDVLAGLAFLKTRKIIDPKRIGLIGHSEGGIVAPIAASLSSDVRYIVLMAGTGLTGEEILYLQTRLIMKANGETEKKIQQGLNQQKRAFAVIKAVMDPKAVEDKLRRMYREEINKLSKEERKKEELKEEQIVAQIKQLTSPWFRFFLTYDPKIALKKVKCPVLAINGTKDLQVPVKENLTAIQEALRQGGNQQVTIKEFPGLNHLFQTANTGSPKEYSQISETISPPVLKLIAEWILKQGR